MTISFDSVFGTTSAAKASKYNSELPVLIRDMTKNSQGEFVGNDAKSDWRVKLTTTGQLRMLHSENGEAVFGDIKVLPEDAYAASRYGHCRGIAQVSDVTFYVYINKNGTRGITQKEPSKALNPEADYDF